MLKGIFLVTLILCSAKYLAAGLQPVDSTTAAPTATEKSFFQKVKDQVGSLFDPFVDWVSEAVDDFLEPIKAMGGLMLRLELVAISLHEHIGFPELKVDEDRRELIVAQTLTSMWQNLETMEKTDAILMNVTEDLVGGTILNNENATKIMFDRIEDRLKENSVLYQKFEEIKSKISFETKLNSTHGNMNLTFKLDMDHVAAFREFISEPSVKKLIMNKRFILAAKRWVINKNEEKVFENFVLARSILKLAQKREVLTKLQNFYGEAVAMAAKNVNPLENLDEGTFLLFAELRSKIDQDPLIKLEIDLIAENVRAKKDDPDWSDDTFDQYFLL